ncbi:LysR substrate-binding domain-containing protein [Rhizosaccharibacter radicis]|uniref:LysR substrate-binding domain-containing protein n=1 Tax=Rhizosaccharibacter radicis TaxID=2782605 RepID=UPI003BF4BF25
MALALERDGTPRGPLRITTLAYGARTVLEPVLPGFLLRYPDVSLELNVEDRPIDIVAEGFDAGIRFGESVERDMISVRAGPDLRTVVVATPGYFRNRPAPASPADLERHDCIGYRLPGSGALLAWEFERDGRQIRLRPSGRLVLNEIGLSLAAIRGGAGLGYMLEDAVAEDLAAGRLVQVLPEWYPPFPGCHLYYPHRQASPALRALADRLRWPRRPASETERGNDAGGWAGRSGASVPSPAAR